MLTTTTSAPAAETRTASALLVCPRCHHDEVVGRVELASRWPQCCGHRMRVLAND